MQTGVQISGLGGRQFFLPVMHENIVVAQFIAPCSPEKR